MHPLQEKFQITVPLKQEVADNDNWVFGEKNFQDSDTRQDPNMVKANFLPPGMEICNQERDGQWAGSVSLGGRSDVSGKLESPESMERGFTRLEMKGTDDQYTGEHVDHFYGDAGGFVERNNYLDRE